MKCIMEDCKYCSIDEDGFCICEAKDYMTLDRSVDCDVELGDD